MRQQLLMARVMLIIAAALLLVALCLNTFPGHWNDILLFLSAAAFVVVLAPIALLTLVFVVVKLIRRQESLSDVPLLRSVTRIWLIVTAASLIAALYFSMFPGSWGSLGLILWAAAFIVVLALISLPLLAIIVARLIRRQGGLSDLPLRAAVAVPVLAVASVFLLVFDVPLRAAFAISRSAFEQAAASASISKDRRTALNKRLGLYHVDEFDGDPRGGVYFRVNTAPDVVDRISYGFVYQPNREGTPFGAAHYELRHLTGDWYVFEVSDDWY